MSYCTRTDIEAIYGALFLSDVLPDLPELDEPERAAAVAAIVAAACDSATSEIDSHIGRRYRLPLARTPLFLKQIAVDVAVYRLCNTHDRLTEEITKRYEHSVKHLGRIAEGKAGLGEAEPSAADGTPPPASAEFHARERRGW